MLLVINGSISTIHLQYLSQKNVKQNLMRQFFYISNLTILHFHNGAVGMHLGALCLISLTGILHQIIIFLSSPFTCTCKTNFQGNQIFTLFFTLIHTLKRQCKLKQKNWCKEENLKGEKGDFIYVPSKRAGNISSIHWKGN